MADSQPPPHDHFPIKPSLVAPHPSLIKVYPTIALGMLRQERTATGRVWLLLRHVDTAGRGWLDVDEARAALCDPKSPWRLCGWRRLRQLLAEGEGVFWTRDERDRIWLRGPARVAAALGVTRLVGRPVGVPAAAFFGGIGDARAHLYAAFHSGRAKEVTSFASRMMGSEDVPNSSLVVRRSSLGSPISRDTLADLSGACPRSQAAYERRVGVASRPNIALGERVAANGPTGPAEQERAWRQGRALFRLKDFRGQHGRPGAVYLAWRLPNGYGPAHGHQQRPKGRQKRINRQLADLFTKGMTGNSERIEKRYYDTAAAAFRGGKAPVTHDELRARSSLQTGHPGHAIRHWPVSGRGQGECQVWATAETTENRHRPPTSASGRAARCFFGDQAGRNLPGL